MEKYTLYIKDGTITIQEGDYVEDGFYIQIINDKIQLFQIPMGGGEEILIDDDCTTVIQAIEAGKELT